MTLALPHPAESADLRLRPVGVLRARDRRADVARRLAESHDGVVHRAALRDAGISRHEVRLEVLAGRWGTAGRHTVLVDGRSTPEGAARWWWAVWESGSGARLDGVSALSAQGMEGYAEAAVHVTVPRESRVHRQRGVTLHWRRDPDPAMEVGVPRSRPEWATLRAAQWARTDRQAALLLCLPVQQRLVSARRLNNTWQQFARGPRRALIGAVLGDLTDGAHSLGELDFAGWCRRYRLPEPTRQSIRSGPGGRVYLDAEWARPHVVVEIDGAHHALGLNPMHDAWRANEVVLEGALVLRLPVTGLRIEPDRFMCQLGRALGIEAVVRTARHTARSA